MTEALKKELIQLGITDISFIPLKHCRITRAYKLKRCGLTDPEKFWVIIFTIPYHTEHKSKNISSYAVARDYHLFCKELFGRLLPRLQSLYPDNRFAGFSDDSPIDERHAAAMSGLGIIGQNGMLITEKHSSYVFLAEIITDLDIKAKINYEIRYCEGCGRCSAACPKAEIGECLSALTQRKGELSEAERDIIRKYGSAWGCDICQEVCPHTALARRRGTLCTDIDFFKTELLPDLTSDIINKMPDSDFSCRAYSWRKRDTILRNLKILEE